MTSLICNCFESLINCFYSRNRVEVADPAPKTYPVLFNTDMWHQNSQIHIEPRTNVPRLTISEMPPSAMFDIASFSKSLELQRLRNEGIRVKGWFLRSRNVLSVYLGNEDPKWQKKLNFYLLYLISDHKCCKIYQEYAGTCAKQASPPFTFRNFNKTRYLVKKAKSRHDNDTSNIVVCYTTDRDKCIIDIIAHLASIFTVEH